MSVVRWQFLDTKTRASVVLPLNPREMSSPTSARNVTFGWTERDTNGLTGVGRPRLFDSGQTTPTEWTFTGRLVDQAHYDLLYQWTKSCRVLRVTDHLDRTFEIIIQKFDPQEKLPSASNPWRADYTLSCLLLKEVTGTVLPPPPPPSNVVLTPATVVETSTIPAFTVLGGTTTPPPSTAVATYFGACPTNPGGESLAAAQTVLTKWGTGASIRQFKTNISNSNHPSGASIVHTSMRPDKASVLNGSLDSVITSLINSTPNGDIIEFYHEPDNDDLTSAGITEMIAVKNYLYDMKQAIKPGVKVAATFTGGFWASYGNDATRDTWISTLRCDLLGLDADGVHDSTGPTYGMSYADEVANVKRYMTRFAFKFPGWTVPEFGTSRQPWDTTGTPRASWIDAQSQTFVDNGAYAVMFYDYNTSAHNTETDYNVIKTGTPEFTTWQARVASNP